MGDILYRLNNKIIAEIVGGPLTLINPIVGLEFHVEWTYYSHHRIGDAT